MQFGATLKELLSYTDIKMYNLADELGYGKSYLSKWVNGVKLPSPKDIDALSYQIDHQFRCNRGGAADDHIPF